VAVVEESVVVEASLAEAWEMYFDPETWPSWVDGFARVQSARDYPERGGELRWESTPAGRGLVTERVLEHEPRRRHLVEFADPESEGELETTFEIVGEQATKVEQTMTYRLSKRGPLRGITDVLFIRPQFRRSLSRSLERFRIEAAERVGR
jgi:uncharacterized membrane protein